MSNEHNSSSTLETNIFEYFEAAKDKFLPGISADAVILGYDSQHIKVLLLKAQDADIWMLPGGFIEKEYDVDVAVHRVVKARTGLEELYFQQFKLFGKSDRNAHKQEHLKKFQELSPAAHEWINQRFVTVGYFALVHIEDVEPKPDLFTDTCEWVALDQLPTLILDHREIIDTALAYLRRQLNYLPLGINLLPERFTMSQFQNLYEEILKQKLDRGNFQRKMLKLDILIRHEKLKSGGAHKAPYLYEFDQEKYHEKVRNGIGFI